MFGLGMQELLIILVIVLVLFGSKKLPELSRGIGEAMKELRKGFSEGSDKDDHKKTAKKDEE